MVTPRGLLAHPHVTVQNGPPVVDEATAREQYLANKTGPWTVSGPNHFVFIDNPKMTSRASLLVEAAKNQFPADYLRYDAPQSIVDGFAKQKEILTKHLSTEFMAAAELIFQGGLFMFSVQHPLSRGYIEIKSKSPWEYPSIDFRYASNPLDLEWQIDALRFGRRVQATPPVQELGPIELSPGPALATDEQLKAWALAGMSTQYHSCCTNPMQPRELGGVADNKAVVHGTSNLRVVDASLMPLIPATHLQSTVYALAEKLADEIKKSL